MRPEIYYLTLNFNPRKTDFSSKKSQNQKNLISEKTCQKILYKIGVSKSIIREAEISSPTSLRGLYRLERLFRRLITFSSLYNALKNNQLKILKKILFKLPVFVISGF
jgi:hypothetical protein